MACSNLTTSLPMLGCCGGQVTAVRCIASIYGQFWASADQLVGFLQEARTRLDGMAYPTVQADRLVTREDTRQFGNWTVGPERTCAFYGQPETGFVMQGGSYWTFQPVVHVIKTRVVSLLQSSFCLLGRRSRMANFVTDYCGTWILEQFAQVQTNVLITTIPYEIDLPVPTVNEIGTDWNQNYGIEKRVVVATDIPPYPQCNLAP